MTKQEFYEDYGTCFSDAVAFMYENGFEEYRWDTLGVESQYSYDEWVDNRLSEMVGGETWQDITEWLNGLPDGYDWYKIDNYGDVYGYDDCDWERDVDDFVEFLDDNGFFDEDDDDESDSTTDELSLVPENNPQEAQFYPYKEGEDETILATDKELMVSLSAFIVG